MLYIPRSDDLFDKNGFFSVVLGDYNREYDYFVATCPYYDMICGVFSSDLATIEYNEEKIASFYKEVGLEASQAVVKYELNRIGMEKILEFEVVQITDWGGVKYVVSDSANNKYYVMVDEIGFVYNVQENDANGKTLYETY